LPSRRDTAGGSPDKFRRGLLPDQPAQFLDLALLALHHRDKIGYTQTSRRMMIVRNKVWFPWFLRVLFLEEDCSSYVTGVYWSAKLPDPNRRGYALSGSYTGTLGVAGTQTVMVQRGDLSLYGRRPWKHVVMRVGRGKRCVSHGSNGGPYFLDYDYRDDYDQTRSYL